MKKSIAIKSFLQGFFLTFGILIAIVLGFVTISTLFKPQTTKTTVTILPDLEGNTKILSKKYPAILQINITGIIGENIKTKDIENILLATKPKERIKAILLYVNTPGGGVNDSDGIYRMLKEYKEKYNKIPIYAYVDGLCASGGFYISAASDKIYASPVSIIGSVGVILGPFFNIFDTLNKLGIKSKTLTYGKDKDTLNPLRPWKENEDKNLQKLGNYFYERFVNIIVRSRKLSKEKLINEYGANIFDGPTAKKIGYIDYSDKNYTDALKDLLKAAKIDAKTPYQVINIQMKKRWGLEILKEKSLETKLKKLYPCFNVKDNFLYLYMPK
jgi:protease-4